MSAIKAILSDFVQKLPKKKEYLEVYINNPIPLKTHYYLL